MFDYLFKGGIFKLKEDKSLNWKKDLAGLSHELKSPLAAIEGAVEMIADRPMDEIMSNKAYIAMIKNNIQRLRGSVDDILEVFSEEERRKLLRFQSTNIVRICFDEREHFQELAKLKNLNVKIHFKNGTPPDLSCDPVKFKLIISNLLSNSIKFTRKGGVIWIIIEHTKDDFLFTVEDNGCGIAKEELPHVFKYFHKKKDASNKYGSGFGLYIAKAWVEAHGGSINAYSAGLGAGTKIRFNIPTSEKIRKARQKKVLFSPSSAPGVCILVL